MSLHRPNKTERQAYRAALYGLRDRVNDEAVAMLRAVFMDDDTDIITHLDVYGYLTGAVSYSMRYDCVRIHSLGSLEAGVGSELIEAVEKLATGLGRPTTLLCTAGSAGFYLKRGYRYVNEHDRELSKPPVRDGSKPCSREPQSESFLDSGFTVTTCFIGPKSETV